MWGLTEGTHCKAAVQAAMVPRYLCREQRQGAQQHLQILLMLEKGEHRNNLVGFPAAGSALRCYHFLIHSLHMSTPGAGVS